jgi:CheY-like chemotaxis protein
VTRAGGSIIVDSTLGDGTTFTFWLPTVSTPVDDAADDGPTEGGPIDDRPTDDGPTDDRPPGRTERRRRPRILAVDDDTELRSVLVDELARHGFVVVGAEDADDALSARDERIDLLVTDVDLPGLDGIRHAEEIPRRLPGHPVILISGAPLDRDGSRPDTRGLELIRKPFALAELAHSIWARLEPMATS